MSRPLGSSSGWASITATSPMRTSPRACFAVARADVDVHVADLRDLLALLVAQQVDRLLADHARDRSVARVEHDPLADEDLRIPAADLAEPQVAVVVDVRDDQPDLVDVAHHEQPPRRVVVAVGGGNERQRRADDIGADLRELAGGLAPHIRRRALVAGRAARGEQVAQQRRHAGCATALGA